MVDIGDPKEVKKRTTKAELEREREVEGLKKVLATYEGRHFIHRLMIECGMQHAPTTHPQATFREIGHQDIWRWIWAEVLEADREAYFLMDEEAVLRDTQTKKDLENGRDDRADG